MQCTLAAHRCPMSHDYPGNNPMTKTHPGTAVLTGVMLTLTSLLSGAKRGRENTFSPSQSVGCEHEAVRSRVQSRNIRDAL